MSYRDTISRPHGSFDGTDSSVNAFAGGLTATNKSETRLVGFYDDMFAYRFICTRSTPFEGCVSVKALGESLEVMKARKRWLPVIADAG
jgi:hypothetical protein